MYYSIVCAKNNLKNKIFLLFDVKTYKAGKEAMESIVGSVYSAGFSVFSGGDGFFPVRNSGESLQEFLHSSDDKLFFLIQNLTRKWFGNRS